MTERKDPREPLTDFGFREVPESEKTRLVGEVFRSVADKYDLMNDVMSFGVHRLWKRFALAQSGVRPGQRVADVAGGTGDLAKQLAARVGAHGQVMVVDINASMLQTGRARLADAGIAGNVHFVQADAERLPFPEHHFDCLTIAFGLRNVTRKAQALASMLRVLKPGGRLLVLEFSHPTRPMLNTLYDAYSFNIIPRLGRLIAQDEDSYRYLAESIRRHPDQEALKAMMQQVGFERVHYFNLSGGIVALHRGYKL